MKRKNNKKIDDKNVRTLCHDCARDYYNSPDFYIEAIYPRTVKDSCTRCTIKRGYDFLVLDKSKDNLR